MSVKSNEKNLFLYCLSCVIRNQVSIYMFDVVEYSVLLFVDNIRMSIMLFL